MPSDFEREYKEYIESTTPDFWDKIEAGIAEDAEASSVSIETVAEPVDKADVSSADVQAADIQAVNESSYVNRDKKVIRWGVFAKRAGQIAAAIALVFVAYTLVQVLAKGGMKSASPTMSESAAPAAAAEAPAEAMAEAAEPVYDDMGPMAEAAEEAVDSATDDMAAMTEEAEAPAAMNEAATDNAAVAGSAEASDSPATLEGDSNSQRLDKENKKDAASLGADKEYKSGAKLQVIESAVLKEMIELPPNEKTNSSSGEQYKYGLTFVSGGETIKCVFTEADVKRCAEQGIHLKKGESYDIFVEPRGDYRENFTSYPYLLKTEE